MEVKIIDYQSDEAPIQFISSLKNTGFAVIENSPIKEDFLDSVYAEWEDFFYSDIKKKYLFDYDKQDGFFPFRSENAKSSSYKDLKEFYHVYNWGRYPEEISSRTKTLFKDLVFFATELLSWIDLNLDKEIKNKLSIPLMNMIQDSESNLMRVIHYPPLIDSDDSQAVRAAAHEDINLLTLLCGSNEPGLQALDNDGNWHDILARPNTISVNSGDMLNMCTGGYFPSTTHRVTNPKIHNTEMNVSRFSIPVFLHPRDDVILKDKYTAGQYLNDRLNEIGLKKTTKV